MHRAYAPFARWVILATGPQAAFMTSAELSGPASHRIRASVKLTHPCQFEQHTYLVPGRLTFYTAADLVLFPAPATVL